MQSTAAISTQNKLAQPTNGRAGPESAQGQDFIAALNRIAYASLAGGVVAAEPALYDTARPPPDDDPAPEPARADCEPCRTRDPEDDPIPAAPQPVRDEARREDAAAPVEPERDRAERPETVPPADSADTAAQSAPPAPDAQRSSSAAAQQGPARTAASPAQTQPVQPSDGEAPPPAQPAPQTANRGGNAGQSPITAQVIDGSNGDRLPQLSHTLSSRSALVAQSDAAKTAPSGDAAPKNAPADGTAASLVASAAQTTAQAAKAKGQGKPGNHNAAGNGATANGAQNAAAQTGQAAAAADAQATALPLQQQQQQRLAAATAGTGDGLNAGTSQTGTPRSEPFTLAGTGHAGSQLGTQNSNAPAQAPKAPPPVPARVITNQVAVQIQKAFGEGGDRISIQLKPAELGRVDVRLDVGHHGHVSAVITADRADTLDLLQRDARILQNALQDAGLQADSNSLTFELKNQEQAFTPSSDGTAGGGIAGEGDDDHSGVAEAAALHARQNVIADDRVDIRV